MTDSTLSSNYRVESLARGLAVLSSFAEQTPTLSLTDIAGRLKLNKTTTFRFLSTLEELGYLQRDQQTKLYRPGLEVLRPHIKVSGVEKKRQIVIGTVEGDIHDIGKNLVKIMFEAAGWTVHDLGRDVQLHRFVEEQAKTGSDIVALSALMTTSMMAMPKVIEMMRAANSDVAVMVGGAPLSRDIARSYGADGYADNAGEAVHEAVKMLERLNR